jgi:hypothetical protein
VSTGWRFVLVDSKTASPLSDLPEARDRRVTFKLNAPAELSFTVPGDSRDAALLAELRTDVIAYWGGTALARLRVGATSDNLDADTHTVDVAALDYLALLDRRYLQNAVTYATTELTTSAWNLIAYTQGRTAGSWGITRGLTATTAAVTWSGEDGKKIGEAISDLHLVYPGFDYAIDPQLRFNTWAFRGQQRDYALEYGGNVTAVSRTFDPERYANVVRQSGKEGIAPAWRSAADLASRPEGRFEAQEGNTDLATTALVGLAADAYLQRHGTVTPTYTMTLAPNAAWTPDALWLGDWCTFVVRSGRLDVVGLERVYEVAVEVTADAAATVSLTFGDFREDLLALVRAVPARLEQMNRR